MLYQPAPKRPARPSRGNKVREWLQGLVDNLMPRAPVYVRVPAYARVRR